MRRISGANRVLLIDYLRVFHEWETEDSSDKVCLGSRHKIYVSSMIFNFTGKQLVI